MEKREPSYTVGGNVSWYNHYEEYGDFLEKTKLDLPHDPASTSFYPHSSEGRQKKQELHSHSLQNENHNHRKLTKMTTWITALCNSLKPC